MATQARAAATRQRIVDAGIALFTERGFSDTGLNDIARQADITPGAFYYHFASKEALAAEIIEQGWPKALAVFTRCLDLPSPGLENVIVMTFALSEVMKGDKSVWIANHLDQALAHLSEDGYRGFRSRAATFVGTVADALARSDIRSGLTLEAVGRMVWITVYGCHLLSAAIRDDVFTRLSESWRILLSAIVPVDSLSYFEQFLIRTTAQFAPIELDEFTARRHAIISGNRNGCESLQNSLRR